jgi:hypothetical protein
MQRAARIRHTAPNAYAVQIRRALEAVCDDRGAAGKVLADRLQNLVDRGELPTVFDDFINAKVSRRVVVDVNE